jgi:hypothetical protein
MPAITSLGIATASPAIKALSALAGKLRKIRIFNQQTA